SRRRSAARPNPTNITIPMPKLCQITVLGLEVRTDWRLVHDRLLDEFPDVTDVLATTMPATILITSRRSVDPDAWLAVISEAVEANRGVRGVWARGVRLL